MFYKRKRPFIRNTPIKRFMLDAPADDTEETSALVGNYTAKTTLVRKILERIHLTNLIICIL